ncbi:MAG: GMC family oxidoreductase, partial [Dehalococcoidia bacterium]
IYANVSLPMPQEWLDESWPSDISYPELLDRYRQVQDMMEVSPYPLDREPYSGTLKTLAHQKAAADTGGDFSLPALAVNFNGPPGHQSQNKHGALQTSCVLCCECDVGCNVHAKNTLDLNYLFVAEKRGADVKPNHEVRMIRPLEEGYAVEGRRLENGQWVAFSLQSRYLVLAAGALGSTELLLRYQKGSGKQLSPMLGRRFSGNGDFLSFVRRAKQRIEPTYGPVITSASRYELPGPGGPSNQGGFFIEDAGFPTFLAYYLDGSIPNANTYVRLLKTVYRYVGRQFGWVKEIRVGDDISRIIESEKATQNIHVLLGMGRDVPDGVMTLNDQQELEVAWELRSSRPYFDRLVKTMEGMGKSLGGKTEKNIIWLLRKVITVHPLGGCVMGDSPSTGVVNSAGQVFNDEAMYVADGSIVPAPIGANPSLTIAALSERIAQGMVARLKQGSAQPE